MAALFVDIIV